MRLYLRIFLAGALAVSVQGQQTWIVDYLNRPGAHFLDLPAAYASAARDDIILLRSTGFPPAPYTTPALVDKGVKIVGEHVIPAPGISGRFDIQNLPATDTLVFAGLWLNGSPTLAASDSAGAIVFENCKLGDRNNASFGPNVFFYRCALVTFSHCEVFCGGMEIRFDDCLLHANDTDFREGRNPWGGVANLNTLVLIDTTAHLANCWVQGGYEPPSYPSQYPTWGNAMHLCNSAVHIGGFSDIQGGGGGAGAGIIHSSSYNCWPGFGPGAFWSIVHRDPSTGVIGGISSLLDDRPGPVTAMTLDAINSSSVTMTQHCRPTSLTLLAGALLTHTPIPGLPFDILLDPATLFVIDFQTGNATGLLSHTLPIPPAIPLGTLLGVQALELTTTGDLLASNVMTVGSL